MWHFIFLLLHSTAFALGTTHWIVTENGRIQPQVDSPFYLSHPDDLIALLEQEKRIRHVNELYNTLLAKKATIDQEWKELKIKYDSEVDFYLKDPECVSTSYLLQELDFYPIVLSYLRDRISVEKYLPLNSPTKGNSEPDCKESGTPEFSLYTFDHLKVMMNRSTLFIKPTPGIIPVLLGTRKVKLFGSQISYALKKNSTSWWHLHLASLYWQIVGNAPKAMECARHAAYHAPRYYKDIALLNIASMVHRCQYPLDALMIMNAAMDHGGYAENFFILGNIYASLGIYNRSVSCYENALILTNDWKELAKTKHIVECYNKVHRQVFAAHTDVQKMINHLQSYHKLAENWLSVQRKIHMDQVPHKLRDLGTVYQKHAEKIKQKGQGCFQRFYYEIPVYVCDWSDSKLEPAKMLEMNVYVDMQLTLKNIETQAMKINLLMSKQPLLDDDEGCILGKLYSSVTGKWIANFSVMQAPIQMSESFHRSLRNLDDLVTTHTLVNKSDEKLSDMTTTGTYFSQSKVVVASGSDDHEKNEQENSVNVFKIHQETYTDSQDNSVHSEEIPFNSDLYETTVDKTPQKTTDHKDNDTSVAVETFNIKNKTKEFLKNLKNSSWPSEDDCVKMSPDFPDLNNYPSLFLPPENKGFNINRYLGELIGLKDNEEHEMPWYHPICHEGTSIDKIKVLKVPKEEHLRLQFVKYSGRDNAVVAEVGQRIMSALQKKIEPRWLIETLAAVYWVIRGNAGNALDCLYTAKGTVPPKFEDVVAVPLGSILLKMNAINEGIRLAKKSLIIDKTQPSSHFLMALMQMKICNFTGAVRHLKKVWSLDENFISPGFTKNFLQAAVCRGKFHKLYEFLTNTEVNCDPKYGVEETPPGPGQEKTYETLVCSESGNECHIMRVPFSVKNDMQDRKPKVVMVGGTQVRVTPVFPKCSNSKGDCVSKFDEDDAEDVNSKSVETDSSEEDDDYTEEDETELERIGDYVSDEISTDIKNEHMNKDKIEDKNKHEYKNKDKDEDNKKNEDKNKDEDKNEVEVRNKDNDNYININIGIGININNEDAMYIDKDYSDDNHKALQQTSKSVSVSLVTPPKITLIVDLPPDIGAGNVKVHHVTSAECENLLTMNWGKVQILGFDASINRLKKFPPLPDYINKYPNLRTPECNIPDVASELTLDNVVSVRLRDRISVSMDPAIEEWLRLITEEESCSLEELGRKISVALYENLDSWRLAMIASAYWRTVGHMSNALSCLRQALYYVHPEIRDIPLIHVSNLLHRAGLYNDALTVGNMALEVNPQSEAAHYTVANIYTSIPNFEKAVTHYQSSLVINHEFIPADLRLRSVLCSHVVTNYATRVGP